MSGSATGVVGNTSFTLVSGTFGIFQDVPKAGGVSAYLLLSNTADACETYMMADVERTVQVGTQILGFGCGLVDSEELQAGTYPIIRAGEPYPSTGPFCRTSIAFYPSTCLAESMTGDDGWVELEHVSDERIAGTFAVHFGEDVLEGTFDSPVCPDLSVDGLGAITTCIPQ